MSNNNNKNNKTMKHNHFYKARTNVFEFPIWGYNLRNIIKQIKEIAKEHQEDGVNTSWFVSCREEGLVAEGGITTDGKAWQKNY